MSNTTSQYISQINQSFPVPGEDNDSQVFRDNFKNISNALYSANSEIDDLQINSVKLTQENNFSSNLIKQAQFKDCSISVYDGTDTPISGNFTVDYTNGSYQKFLLSSGNHDITINNWPNASQSGSLRLVLDADSQLTTQVNFVASNLINVSSSAQPFSITTSTSYVFDLTSDGVVGTLFVQRVNSPILTASTIDVNSNNITGTNVTVLEKLIIDSNEYTVDSVFNTVVTRDNKIGKVALLPQQITTTITGLIGDLLGSGTTTTFTIASGTGIATGSTFSFTGTNTVYSVTAIDNNSVTTQEFDTTQNWITVDDSIIFTNPKFDSQPTLLNLVADPITSVNSTNGDLAGQVYATTSSMFITFADSAPGTVNKIEVPSVNSLLPYGSIIMWYGSIATIPSGWALCNGSNGTPNLVNRFIIGASTDTGSTATTNVTGSDTATGGSKDAVVVTHNHTATEVIQTGTFWASNRDGPAPTGVFTYTNNVASSSLSGGGLTGDIKEFLLDVTHSHDIASTGTSGTNANLPPYYALAFIMKI